MKPGKAFLPLMAMLLAPSGATSAQDFDPRGLAEVLQAAKKTTLKAAAHRPYVVLNRFVCAGAKVTPADLQTDIQEAQEVFSACGVGVRAVETVEIRMEDGSPCPDKFKLPVDHDSAVLPATQRTLFSRYHHQESGLSVFYLPWRDGPGAPTMAGTSIPESYVKAVKSGNAADMASVGALVVFQGARAFMGQRLVLPHEMGHILVDYASHDVPPGNLLEKFNKGKDLSDAQCAAVRASPFIRRD